MAATRTGSVTKFINAFRGWYVYAAGYRQMGLRADDLINEENNDVIKAITRLPEEQKYERIFRIKRALDLSMKHAILPKAEWTKPEEDNLYLTPMVEQVIAERKEREHYDRM